MSKPYFSLALIVMLGLFAGCSKTSDPVANIDTSLNAQVISEFSLNVANAEYQDLKAKATLLNTQAIALAASPTDANIAACRQTWKDARKIWEQSEAQLFGPVETDNIDPHIDTWPVNFTDLDAQLASNNPFTVDYINSLDDALKGFHPIEYLIFGKNGNKTASQLTTRELEYLTALTLNVKTLTSALADNWVTTSSANFYSAFTAAGSGSTVYTTQQAALEQLVNAMADICGEVAESKMYEPYVAQDPSLEESPFAQSSMTDFINNITGIQNVYLGKYQADGKGLEDIVKTHNLSLDNTIKTKLSAALAAMNNITLPFGQAIINQRTQVQAAMTAIGDLKSTLEDELYPFIVQHSN